MNRITSDMSRYFMEAIEIAQLQKEVERLKLSLKEVEVRNKKVEKELVKSRIEMRSVRLKLRRENVDKHRAKIAVAVEKSKQSDLTIKERCRYLSKKLNISYSSTLAIWYAK